MQAQPQDPATINTYLEAAALFLGPLFGAVVALLGVWATLWHESKERRKEREFTQRREVYINAAEAIAKQSMLLTAIGRLDLPPSNFGEFLQGNPGWMNKLHLVASISTIKRLMQAHEVFVTGALDLVRDRFILDGIVSEIGARERDFEQAQAYQTQLASALNAIYQQRESSEAQQRLPWVLLEQEKVNNSIERLSAHLSELHKRRMQAHRALIEKGIAASLEYQRLLVDTDLAIRSEMGFTVNEEEFRAALIGSADRMVARFQEILDEFESNKPSPKA